MTSKTVLEGSSPSTPAKIRANPLGLVLIFVREDSNPERVFAPEKQFCELFLAKRCEDRYQKAKPLGGRADKTPQAAVSFYPCQRRNKFRLFRFFYAKNQSPLHCSSFFPQNRWFCGIPFVVLAQTLGLSHFLLPKFESSNLQFFEHQFWISVIFNYIFDDGAWSWDSNNYAWNEHQFRIRSHPFLTIPSATSSF